MAQAHPSSTHLTHPSTEQRQEEMSSEEHSHDHGHQTETKNSANDTMTLQESIERRAKLTNELKAKYPNLHVLKETKFQLRVHTMIRDQNVSRADFLFYADQLIRTLIEAAFETLPCKERTVTTPTGQKFNGLELEKEVIGVSIMRAGEAMEQALLSTVRGVKLGKILIQRDESSPEKTAKLFYSKLPDKVNNFTVMLMDPMLASGSSAALAIEVLKHRGVDVKDITFVNLIAAPEGITYLMDRYPDLKIVTTMIDECLNADKYILPGVGDFGDRYFGT